MKIRPFEALIARSHRDRGFRINLEIYVIVNAVLLVTWVALSLVGVADEIVVRPFPQGFFYPIVPIVVWGAILLVGAYLPHRSSHVTEEEIEREMKRLRH